MLKRIFLLSVILLATVGRPVRVSALTPEERFDSLMTEAIRVRDVHDYIVKLQEAEEYYSNNVMMDFPGKDYSISASESIISQSMTTGVQPNFMTVQKPFGRIILSISMRKLCSDSLNANI